jgi:hypothetical protein
MEPAAFYATGCVVSKCLKTNEEHEHFPPLHFVPAHMNSSSLHPWTVLRGLLLELSSREVPEVVDRAGLLVDWTLSSQQDFSNQMRITAYRPRIDTAYAQLQEDEKVRVAYIIARELASRGLGEKMDASLRAIGWRIENGKLAPDSEPVRELFFPKQSQHDAYVEIRRILQRGCKKLCVNVHLAGNCHY